MASYTLINTASDGTGAWVPSTAASLSFSSTGVNLNTTGDVFSIIAGLPARFLVSQLLLSNFSGIPTALVAATLRDTATAGGNSLVGALVALNGIVTSTTLVMRAVPLTTALAAAVAVTTAKLYLNVSAANGSALTADITVTVVALP